MEINYGDARSFKMAVIADYFMNPQNYPKLPEASIVYEQLRDAGFGIIKMPQPSMIGKSLDYWIETTVDQVQEYSKRGFRIFLLGAEGITGKGIWMTEINREIKKRGLAPPKSIVLKRKQFQERKAICSIVE